MAKLKIKFETDWNWQTESCPIKVSKILLLLVSYNHHKAFMTNNCNCWKWQVNTANWILDNFGYKKTFIRGWVLFRWCVIIYHYDKKTVFILKHHACFKIDLKVEGTEFHYSFLWSNEFTRWYHTDLCSYLLLLIVMWPYSLRHLAGLHQALFYKMFRKESD